MIKIKILGAAVALGALSACAATTQPVEVTRFHAEDRLAQLSTIAVEAAPGANVNSLELAAYQQAVSRELAELGYREVASGSGAQVAEVRIDRGVFRDGDRRGSSVGVGVGGSTGGYRSGVGVGVGVNLGNIFGGGPKDNIGTQLSVVIRDRASGQSIWEGRAEQVVREDSELADTAATANRLADALFAGFPGESGETIEVE